MSELPFIPYYPLLTISGLVVAACIWSRRSATREVPVMVFVGGLIGAVIGAKVVYWLIDLPFQVDQPVFWLHALVGRTVMGGLLGGYGGVEIAKKWVNHPQATGDGFALVCPIGLAIGRIGCYLQGCCQGLVCEPAWYTTVDRAGAPRYPIQLLETAFNLVFALTVSIAVRRRWLAGQWFHVYLIIYGVFRFVTEFVRETPRILVYYSPYQILAGVMILFGIWRYRIRVRSTPPITMVASP